jgi:BatD DUF11 like domain
MKHLLAFLLLLAPLLSLAQSPVIRAHLEPTTNIMVGQPVRLVVSIYVPNYFTGAPDFPEFEVDNAIVVLPQDRPVHSNTQIDNTTYFGITQTYVIYPQQAGDYHVPPAKFSVPYAIAPPKSTTVEVTLPPLRFHADVPAVARDLPYFLPTTQLTMKQTWSRSLTGLRAGDTVIRTITTTAAKMQAMLIPPLELEQSDGIRIYSSEPTVRDQKTPRGEFIYGQRVQAAKYFVEKPGDYTLPSLELQWWNLTTHKLVTAVLPPTKFTAVENPGYKAELPPPVEAPANAPMPHANWWSHRRTLALRFVWIASLGVFLFFLWKLGHRLYPRMVDRIEERKASEPLQFRRLTHAANSNDAKQTYVLLLAWLVHVHPGFSLDAVIQAAHDGKLANEIDALGKALYSRDGSSTAWTGSGLAARLNILRRNLNFRLEQKPDSLAMLNPEGH